MRVHDVKNLWGKRWQARQGKTALSRLYSEVRREGVAESTSPPLHAHKSIVDRGRLIEPVARVAVRRLTARGPTVGIERELVMSHRGLVTLRALWLDGRARNGLGSRGKQGRTARHQSNDRQERRHAFHLVPTLDGDIEGFIGRGRDGPHASLYQNTCSPSAISASGESRMISERAFFAPRISTSD